MNEEDIFGDEIEAPEGQKAPEKKPEPEVVKPEPGGVAPAVIKTPANPEPSKSAEDQAEMILEKLFDKGKIVKLSASVWDAKKKLQAKDIGKKKSDLPAEVIILGQKRLIKKSSIDPVKSIENKARALVESHSHESWIPGLRFMTDAAAQKVKQDLSELADEFAKAVDDFVKEYPKLKKQMLEEYPQYASALEPFYPSPEDIRKKFKFVVNVFEITVARKEAEILSEAKVAIKQDLTEKLDVFLKETVQDTRKQFIEELSFVKEKLDSGDKVHGKTVAKIKKMIDIAHAKNLVNDSEFFTLLDKFKKGFDKESVNDPDNKKTVTKELEEILGKAENAESVEEAVDEYKRSILV